MEIPKLLVALIVYGALLVLVLIVMRGTRDPVLRYPRPPLGDPADPSDSDLGSPDPPSPLICDCGCDPFLDSADPFV